MRRAKCAANFLGRGPGRDPRFGRWPPRTRKSMCAGMPPKKKMKVSDRGQLKLCFNQSQSSSHVTTSDTVEESPDTVEESPQETVVVESADNAATAVPRRGNVANWRSFGDSKWRGIHPWLILKEDGVYCQFCSHANLEVRSRSSVFVTKPYVGNRPDKLGRHAACFSHLQSQFDFQEWQNRVATQSTVVQMIERNDLLTVDEQSFCDALRCMYWLNKNEIAHTTNFSELKELCVLLGNETLPSLQKSGNTSYESEQIKQEMVEAIGSTLEEKMLIEVRDSPFYSIVLDESTDISVKKQLGICVHYLGKNGTLRVRNLKLLEVNHGTADVITDAMMTYLTSSAPVVLDINKLAGGATDGASVMVGCETGVVTRIKNKVPTFIATHCSAHRLSLAACDASNSSSLIQRFQKILNQIYVYFSRSSVCSSELVEMQKFLDEPQLKLQRPTETRWLSHQNAVDTLRRCLRTVYVTLQHEASEGDATAHGLSKEIEKPAFVASLLLLSNILAILGNLSRTFQLAQLNLLSVEQLVVDAKAALLECQKNPLKGGYMTELDITTQAIGITAQLDKTIFTSNAHSYIEAIIQNLNNRFPQLRTLSLLGYFDPRNVQTSNATPFTMLEIVSELHLQVDGHKLW